MQRRISVGSSSRLVLWTDTHSPVRKEFAHPPGTHVLVTSNCVLRLAHPPALPHELLLLVERGPRIGCAPPTDKSERKPCERLHAVSDQSMQHLKSPLKQGHKIISPTTSAGGTSGAGSVDINSNGTMFSGSPEAKESIASRSEANYPIIDSHSGIWDARRNKKLLRFVTVIAYIFFVSLAAIVLSLYYYFFHVPHMGTSGFLDGRSAEETLKAVDFAAQSPPIESFVGRGRKRFPLQHNVNHFPFPITPTESHPPEASSQVVTSSSLSKCDEQTPSPSFEGDEEPAETTTATIAVQFTRHESPPETVAQALPLISRTYSLPTVPSVYEMISRRLRGKPASSLQRRETERSAVTSPDNYDD